MKGGIYVEIIFKETLLNPVRSYNKFELDYFRVFYPNRPTDQTNINMDDI